MEYRLVTLSNGKTVKVMRRIQRIDTKYTHGWQVRYKGTKFFSDGSEGHLVSLKNAEAELIKRIQDEPISDKIRSKSQSNKKTDLPVGISGPHLRNREGRAPCAEFQVLVPIWKKVNRNIGVYIGTEKSWSQKRYDTALEKAIKIRTEAVQEYERQEKAASLNSLFSPKGKIKVDPAKFKKVSTKSISYVR